MERLTDLLFEVWDFPIFQMVQGIILGLMIAAGIALIVKGFKKEEDMSGDRWRYSPEKCDGDFCPCDCDKCPKCWEDVEEEDDDQRNDSV